MTSDPVHREAHSSSRRPSWVLVLAVWAGVLVGCGDIDCSVCPRSDSATEEPGTPEAMHVEFWSPDATLMTLQRAARNDDRVLAGRCFSRDSDRKFTAVRENALTEQDWREFAEVFSTITWADVPASPDGMTAIARVTVVEGGLQHSDDLQLVKEVGEWKVRGRPRRDVNVPSERPGRGKSPGSGTDSAP